MGERAHEPGVGLDVILTAEIPTPRNYVFRRGANPAARTIAGLRPTADLIRSPCLAFALRHPDAGTILIDTGMHADALQSLRKDFGTPMSLLFRSMRPASKPYDVQLRALGIEPSSVGAVLMTHLHVDHTSGMRLLPGAQFTCTRQEWEATRPRLAAAKGYVSHHLPAASRMRLIDLDSHGTRFGPFSRTQDLLGDGSIRLISTPGHTVGHMSVLLQLDDRRRVLIVGDAAYTLRSIDEGILPMLTDDDANSLRSMREIKAFADSEPDAILVPSHDPEAWHRLREVA